MACPVLAAVALKKVDLRSQGDAAVRGSVSPFSAVCLLLCSLAFVVLDMASALRAWLPHQLMFRVSKFLVHLCAIFQMLLAYMILLLIAMKFEASMVVLVVFGPFIVYCCYLSVVRSEEQSERAADECDKNLEPSLEFSAAVTSLLFLGLEGLALEGQTAGVGRDLDPRLVVPLCLTFVFCVMASAVMLLAAVPPIDYNEAEQCRNMCKFLHFLVRRANSLLHRGGAHDRLRTPQGEWSRSGRCAKSWSISVLLRMSMRPGGQGAGGRQPSYTAGIAGDDQGDLYGFPSHLFAKLRWLAQRVHPCLHCLHCHVCALWPLVEVLNPLQAKSGSLDCQGCLCAHLRVLGGGCIPVRDYGDASTG
ncbi:unnamed protein product [Miscanthus lutarioriparius]|uniref:Uncharacterized protein n=1 Tax=Miscanthus lutarioriparius TaxID=422564 RepID=A0A811NPU2_9POAL|nr:unnamed protein product [Miscanthus lutarioriparius]